MLSFRQGHILAGILRNDLLSNREVHGGGNHLIDVTNRLCGQTLRLVLRLDPLHPAITHQLPVELLQIHGTELFQRDFADVRSDVVINIAPICLMGGGANLDLTHVFKPFLHPLGNRVLACPSEVYFLGFFQRLFQFFPNLCLCLAQYIFEYLFPCNRVMPCGVTAFPTAILLRKEWGYDGLVVSDWVAVHNRTAAVRGGCDLTMPADAERDRELVEAVKVGVLDEEMLNEAVRNLLRLIAKCQPAAELPQNYDYDAAHKEAVRAAAESMVLLKNEGNTLPIQKGQKVALIGKFAQQTRFQGGGSSKVNPYRVSSLLEAAGVEAAPDLTYFEGFGFGQNPDEEKERAAAAGAQAADVAIVFAGLPEAMESEGFDRWVMKLPICQNRLIEKVCAVQPNTIVVLQNGGAVEMPWVEKPKAILEAYLGGEGAAEAIWAVLTGAVNPSGRLAETFPLRYEDTPAYLTWPGEGSRVEYTEGVYIGYRWYATRKMPVLFPFGHGLSYTTFAYSDLKVSSSQYKAGETVEVCVTVTNTGDRAGKEVVQLYVGVDPLTMGVKRPVRELRRFAKVALQPGESKTVNFSLDKRAFAIWDKDVHDWRVPGGTYFVEICKNAQEVLLSQPIQAENEYISTGQVYDMMTPIIDIEEHPVGAAFLRKVMPVVEAMIARLGHPV